MKRWYALFTLKDKPVMGCWVEEDRWTRNEDDAVTAAGFKALFAYPNVGYDNITITQTEEVPQ